MTARGVRFGSAATAAVLLVPSSAHAHLVNSGLGPFYDGLGHFAMTPEDLLPALAMALLAGQRGAGAARHALLVLPGAWLLAGLAGLVLPTSLAATGLAAGSFLAVGGLVAAAAPLRPGAVAALALLIGAVHGYLNGSAMSQAKLGTLGLIGIVTALFLLTALASATVVAARAPWTRIAVRVAGSWIAAVGLLFLGWSLRTA